MKYDHLTAVHRSNPAYSPVRHPEVERNKSFGLGHNLGPWRKAMSTKAPGLPTTSKRKQDRGLGGLVKRLAGIV